MTDAAKTDSRRITIFDTTLRDGEQSPGASMNLAEKMEIAQALVELGVDVIEAGFPIASPGDFEAVQEIARTVRGAVICGLARCRNEDIDRAWEAVRHAQRGQIHVFLATGAIHRQHKLKMDKDEIIRCAVAGIERAAGYLGNVEFSPEDAARTETDFLCKVVEAAIAAGATTVNIPDTVGCATPSHMQQVIQTLRQRVPNIDRAVISVHCHNDLGMAVANSLAAVEAGAGQVECTMNGLGERAGNCSLEEIVMALRIRNDYYHADTGVQSRRLVPTSRLVANVTGMMVQRNKAIVGENAFAHEAGIHQDGILKERTTYEIMRPEDVGFAASDLVLGKHSGRAALASRAKTLGYTLTNEQLQTVFEQFKVAGRQEEGNLRRRHCRPDRAGNPLGERALVAMLVSGGLRHGQGAPGHAAAEARRGGIQHADGLRRRPGGRRLFGHRATDRRHGGLPGFQGPQCHGGQGRARRGAGRGGTPGPRVSRPRRFHRQRGGQCEGILRRRQSHRGQRRRASVGGWIRSDSGRVAESADAQDLKSCGLNRPYGFKSRLGY